MRDIGVVNLAVSFDQADARTIQRIVEPARENPRAVRPTIAIGVF